jgi:hypothetical protein
VRFFSQLCLRQIQPNHRQITNSYKKSDTRRHETREKRLPLHPTKQKKYVSIPEKDEIKHIHFTLEVADDTQREKMKLIYKQDLKQPTGKAPLLHYNAQKSSYSQRKKSPQRGTPLFSSFFSFSLFSSFISLARHTPLPFFSLLFFFFLPLPSSRTQPSSISLSFLSFIFPLLFHFSLLSIPTRTPKWRER